MSAPGKKTSEVTGWFAGPFATLAPLDEKQAREAAADVAQAAREADCPRLAALVAGPSEPAAFLAAVFDLSPFLLGAVRRRPEMLERLFDEDIASRLAALHAHVASLAAHPDVTEKTIMAELRRAKGEAHVLIALQDLAARQDTQATVRALSDLADVCVRAAIDFLLRDAARQGKLALPSNDQPAENSGWIVIGMGKLGAGELNYSSDIDLVVFFDPRAPAVIDEDDATDLFSRLTRRLVRILQDRTEDGYVFRTDLRLRPDPGSTPLAIPVEAALNYYEARGQNWERAAMIKARPVAGDIAAGQSFLAELKPYRLAQIHGLTRPLPTSIP